MKSCPNPILNSNFTDIVRIRWDCVFATCVHCKTRKQYQVSNLKRAKSCGCLGKSYQAMIKAARKHGDAAGRRPAPEYTAWSHMKRRCRHPAHPSYWDYGGRGIDYCDRWESYENFVADMGRRPPNSSLGRIDNNKGYYKENCRWETRKQQQRNTRANHLVELRGEVLTVAEWCERYGIKACVVYWRLGKDWPPMRALTEPLNEKFGRRYAK